MLGEAHRPSGGAGRAEFRANLIPLVGSAIGASFGLGLLTPVSSMFFRALESEFQWTKAAAATSLVAFVLTAAALPVIGWLLDRFGAAVVAFWSTLGLSACLFSLSLMSGALAQYYVISAVLAVVGVGAGPISYTRVIAHDFQDARGLALALALAGGAVTGMVVPLVISQVIAADGWRHAYRVLAWLSLAGGLLAVWLIRRRRTVTSVSRPSVLAGHSVREALRTRAFWLLSGVLFLVSVATIGFFSQLQSIGVEKGLSPQQAAWMASLLAFSVVPSRLLVGWALDALDPRLASAAALLVAAAGAIVILLAPQGSWGVFALGVVMIAASLGAEFDMMSFFCAHCFGLKNYASVFGFLMGAFYIGFAVGGVSYGAAHDWTGGYGAALAGAAACLVLGSGALIALPRRPLAAEAAAS